MTLAGRAKKKLDYKMKEKQMCVCVSLFTVGQGGWLFLSLSLYNIVILQLVLFSRIVMLKKYFKKRKKTIYTTRLR